MVFFLADVVRNLDRSLGGKGSEFKGTGYYGRKVLAAGVGGS